MPSVLKRLTRPLPRQFNRPVTQGTRMFVERRHKRDRQHSRERSRRWVRRWRTFLVERLAASRRWFKYLLALAAVLVVCLFLFSPLLQIREVRVVRTEGRVDLQKVLETLSPLYGQHLLFLSTRDVTARVRQVVPDAVSVSVTKQYPSQVSVRIMLAPLVAHVRIAADETLLASGSGVGGVVRRVGFCRHQSGQRVPHRQRPPRLRRPPADGGTTAHHPRRRLERAARAWHRDPPPRIF